ncbi:hypothetical protein CpipJ_CPIJ003205, partial [Culex quinquefasciatus]
AVVSFFILLSHFLWNQPAVWTRTARLLHKTSGVWEMRQRRGKVRLPAGNLPPSRGGVGSARTVQL